MQGPIKRLRSRLDNRIKKKIGEINYARNQAALFDRRRQISHAADESFSKLNLPGHKRGTGIAYEAGMADLREQEKYEQISDKKSRQLRRLRLLRRVLGKGK